MIKLLAVVCAILAGLFDGMRDGYIWGVWRFSFPRRAWHAVKFVSLVAFVGVGALSVMAVSQLWRLPFLFALALLEMVVFELSQHKGLVKDTVIYLPFICMRFNKTKACIMYFCLVCAAVVLIVLAK